MSLISFTSILLVSLVILTTQFIVFRDWVIDFEEEDIKSRATQLEILLNNENNFDSYNKIINSMDLEVVIYDENKNIVLNNLEDNINYIKEDLINKNEIKVDFNLEDSYVYLTKTINIDDKNYHIFIQKESEAYNDFFENMMPIYMSILIIGAIISLLAGMYISKQFMNRLNKLSKTMIDVKEKGLKSRIEIKNPKDEFDKINIIFNEMMDSLQQSFDTQNQFVQDASHELRTPLTILKGHLKMLDRWGKNDPSQLDKSLKISIDEVDRLTKLVNDLLELGKVEKDSIIDSQNINLNEDLHDIINDFKMINPKVNYKLELDKDLYICMNPKHFKQLMIIFLDNAIKYCDKPSPNISISTYKTNNSINISIKDNGVGIPKAEIPKITEKFYRVDKSRKYNNSFGIGLSIAVQILRLYDCELEIRSEVGVGSEFIIKYA